MRIVLPEGVWNSNDPVVRLARSINEFEWANERLCKMIAEGNDPASWGVERSSAMASLYEAAKALVFEAYPQPEPSQTT